ncbi:MAG: 30S ribosomal protein S15 [Bdellovibrionales bacterium]|nr:30S ribosomal protein S15 [Bdellovibrionales bacterium]
MGLDKSKIEQIRKQFSRSEKDTGSPEVQVALLTNRISILTEHFKKHKKDHHSKRDLFKIVSRRKRLLNYIKKTNPKIYRTTIQVLSLRK